MRKASRRRGRGKKALANAAAAGALGILVDTGPIPAGRLAKITGLTTGAVTGIVDRLERAGHVRRERGSDDRRKVIIQPVRTPEHDQAAGGSFAPLLRAVEEDVAGYSEDELALILEFMDRHAATLQRITIEVRKVDDPRSQ